MLDLARIATYAPTLARILSPTPVDGPGVTATGGQAMASLSSVQKAALRGLTEERYGTVCAYCGVTNPGYDLCHDLPADQGGRVVKVTSNIMPGCNRCNRLARHLPLGAHSDILALHVTLTTTDDTIACRTDADKAEWRAWARARKVERMIARNLDAKRSDRDRLARWRVA